MCQLLPGVALNTLGLMKESMTESRSTLCRSCGFCCSGVVCETVVIEPSEDSAFVEQYRDHIIASESGTGAFLVEPCPAHDNICTAYSTRPIDCRKFECSLLKRMSEGATSLESALEMVSELKGALEKLVDQLTKANKCRVTHADALQRVREQHREADDVARKKLWRSSPEYMLISFLIDNHFK